MITCDGCDIEISEEHTPVQTLRRYPHRVSKGDGPWGNIKKELDLDLHLCTKCYRGAKEFSAFWEFIVTKQYMKELTKDMKLKPKKNWMSGLTDEELQLQQQEQEEEQLN